MTLTFEFCHKKLVRELRVALSGLALFGALALVAHGCSGCKPALTADQSYEAKILACSSTAKTKAEAKACRDAVNREYNVCESPGGWPQYVPCD